jgi:hypothetical protein
MFQTTNQIAISWGNQGKIMVIEVHISYMKIFYAALA